jgi:hypothetical protein
LSFLNLLTMSLLSGDKFEMFAMKIRNLFQNKSVEKLTDKGESSNTKENMEEYALLGFPSQVQRCNSACQELYSTLNNEYDEMKSKYNEYFIKVQAYDKAVKTLEKQKVWFQKNQLAYEEKIKVLERDLKNTTNELKHSESQKAEMVLEKQDVQTKLDNTLARFNKWKDSSKNLNKLVDSSMSTKTKRGLGYGNLIGPNQFYDPNEYSVFNPEPADYQKPVKYVKEGGMNAVSPPIRGVFMPTPVHSLSDIDSDESQIVYGKKSKDLPESNDCVPCHTSDKSSEAESKDFVSCDSSEKSTTPKYHKSSSSTNGKSAPKSAFSDNSSINSFKNNCVSSFTSDNGVHIKKSCSKNKAARKKTCFVCGSQYHLIKDCDYHEKRMKMNGGQQQTRSLWKNVKKIPPYVPQAAGMNSYRAPFPVDRPVPAGKSVAADSQGTIPAGASSSFQRNFRPAYYNPIFGGGMAYSPWFPW